jgi:hypothetical protein
MSRAPSRIKRTKLERDTLEVATPAGYVTITVGVALTPKVHGYIPGVLPVPGEPPDAVSVAFSGGPAVRIMAGLVRFNNSAGEQGCTVTGFMGEIPVCDRTAADSDSNHAAMMRYELRLKLARYEGRAITPELIAEIDSEVRPIVDGYQRDFTPAPDAAENFRAPAAMSPARFKACLDALLWTPAGLADYLGINARTVQRMGAGDTAIPAHLADWLEDRAAPAFARPLPDGWENGPRR